MQWMRRALMRKLTAGLAIAATALHAAALSLHITMIASLALAGNAVAGERTAGLSFCAPGHVPSSTDIGAGRIDGDTSSHPGTASTAFCPACNASTAPALVLPDANPLTVLAAMEATAGVANTPAVFVSRHETERRQSRGPPHQVRL